MIVVRRNQRGLHLAMNTKRIFIDRNSVRQTRPDLSAIMAHLPYGSGLIMLPTTLLIDDYNSLFRDVELWNQFDNDYVRHVILTAALISERSVLA